MNLGSEISFDASKRILKNYKTRPLKEKGVLTLVVLAHLVCGDTHKLFLQFFRTYTLL